MSTESTALFSIHTSTSTDWREPPPEAATTNDEAHWNQCVERRWRRALHKMKDMINESKCHKEGRVSGWETSHHHSQEGFQTLTNHVFWIQTHCDYLRLTRDQTSNWLRECSTNTEGKTKTLLLNTLLSGGASVNLLQDAVLIFNLFLKMILISTWINVSPGQLVVVNMFMSLQWIWTHTV